MSTDAPKFVGTYHIAVTRGVHSTLRRTPQSAYPCQQLHPCSTTTATTMPIGNSTGEDRETGGKKLEDPKSVKSKEMAQLTFQLQQPLVCGNFKNCEGLFRVDFMNGNGCEMLVPDLLVDAYDCASDIISEYVAIQAALFLYTSGCITSIVADSSECMSRCVPAYEGFALPQLIPRLDLTGRGLIKYFMKILIEQSYSFTTTAECEIMRDVKGKFVCIALDFNTETREAVESSDKEKTCECQDGSEPTLSAYALRTSFVYFSNSLVCGLTHQSHSERFHLDLAVLAIFSSVRPSQAFWAEGECLDSQHAVYSAHMLFKFFFASSAQPS